MLHRTLIYNEFHHDIHIIHPGDDLTSWITHGLHEALTVSSMGSELGARAARGAQNHGPWISRKSLECIVESVSLSQ